jgi:hypothetical protein
VKTDTCFKREKQFIEGEIEERERERKREREKRGNKSFHFKRKRRKGGRYLLISK